MKKSVSRKADHAGSWYSDDPKDLHSELSSYLAKADQTVSHDKHLKCLISPHAGFAYSGPTAAWAYKNINPVKYKTVVILGPSHHAYLDSCAVSGASTFETPLGDLKAHSGIVEYLLESKIFPEIPMKVDEAEHSIEM